jgi:hypothetical protein
MLPERADAPFASYIDNPPLAAPVPGKAVITAMCFDVGGCIDFA